MSFEDVYRPAVPGVLYACPCCRYTTLSERGGYDICQICFWEDDGQDDHDATEVRGGPNSSLSLVEARQNYREFGASQARLLAFVRPPTDEERRTRIVSDEQ